MGVGWRSFPLPDFQREILHLGMRVESSLTGLCSVLGGSVAPARGPLAAGLQRVQEPAVAEDGFLAAPPAVMQRELPWQTPRHRAVEVFPTQG